MDHTVVFQDQTGRRRRLQLHDVGAPSPVTTLDKILLTTLHFMCNRQDQRCMKALFN